jgi:hypothetical protein
VELVLKKPENKPPFIGLLFESEYEATRINATWVNNYSMDKYEIIFEPKGTKITLRLINKGMGLNHPYENVDYKPELFKTFLKSTKAISIFNFSHIINTLDGHKVVRAVATGRLFVLKVEKIYLLYEH